MKAGVNLERVVFMFQDARAYHFRLIKACVLIVVLVDCNHLLERCSWNEHCCEPVMNRSVWRANWVASSIARIEMDHIDIARSQISQNLLALRGGQGFEVEEISRLEAILLHACLGGTDVSLEASKRFWPKFGAKGSWQVQEHKNGENQRPQRTHSRTASQKSSSRNQRGHIALVRSMPHARGRPGDSRRPPLRTQRPG